MMSLRRRERVSETAKSFMEEQTADSADTGEPRQETASDSVIGSRQFTVVCQAIYAWRMSQTSLKWPCKKHRS